MLEVNDLHIHFHGRDHDSVRGVSFSIRTGEIVGLVGESGCGKTITSMAICGLLSRKLASCTGSVKLDGQEILTMSRADMRKLQGSAMSVVFQEPMSSMDPCMRVGPQIEEALTLHTDLSPAERREKALQAMHDAELPRHRADPPTTTKRLMTFVTPVQPETTGQDAARPCGVVNEPETSTVVEPSFPMARSV